MGLWFLQLLREKEISIAVLCNLETPWLRKLVATLPTYFFTLKIKTPMLKKKKTCGTGKLRLYCYID